MNAGGMALMGIVLAGVAWAASGTESETRAHVRSQFAFDLGASREVVAPLFGSYRERSWAQGWEPRFVWPLPAEDKPGEVFTVTHGAQTSTWVNTALDLDAGHIQYVYVVPEAMAVAVDIHVTVKGSTGTHVDVSYERTALSAHADDRVKALGDSDRESAAHWQRAIEECLKKEGTLR
jgi:hypothetical protein